MKELKYGYQGAINLAILALIIVLMFMLEWIMSRFSDFRLLVGSIVSLIISVPFLFNIYLKYRYRKRLLNCGVCHDAEVIAFEYCNDILVDTLGISYSYGKFINMGFMFNYHPFRIELRYCNRFGNVLLIKSKRFYYKLPNDINKYKANIWVNPKNEKEQYIQLFYIKQINPIETPNKSLSQC